MTKLGLNRWLLLLTACLLMAGCGDDSGDSGGGSNPPPGGSPPPSSPPSSSPPPSTPPPSNSPLSISGSPAPQVMSGSAFSFTPTVTAPDGATVSFSISNRPGWAQFNNATGRLNGTPGAGDLGTYADIRITVAAGEESVTLGPFSIAVVATASGSATLSWLPPTEREDGSPLFGDLAGYNVYWGTSMTNMTNVDTIANPGVTTYVVEQLVPATYYFAITAFDTSGLESARSNTAFKTVN